LNVVLIVADDLGVGDVGCYGDEGRIPTPNLDRLASQGVRALDVHSTSAVCTLSRYAMITGTYYWQEWIGELLVDTGKPTIASVFKDNGYATRYLLIGICFFRKVTMRAYTAPAGGGKFEHSILIL